VVRGGFALRHPLLIGQNRYGIGRRALLAAVPGLVLCRGDALAASRRKARGKREAPKYWDATLTDIQRRTFDFFWHTSDAKTGLAPDRWPSNSYCSIAAVGFALTAYCIGVHRGFVSRSEAAERTLTTLRTFWNGRQGDAKTGCIGYKGFFYHFLDFKDGNRFSNCELSNVDTTMFFLGALTAAAFFNRKTPVETEIRGHAYALYERADWSFFEQANGVLSMGWDPETGFNRTTWNGYDEGMMIYLLAMASPKYPLSPESWAYWCATYDLSWGTNFGAPHLGFGPMMGHQYTEVWYDLQHIVDPYMRSHHSNYFENSRLATVAQRNYAIANPKQFADYGPNIWGLTACDGPGDVTLKIDGREIQFHSYSARGPSQDDDEGVLDDGTLAPTAAISSVVFAPDICIQAAKAMLAKYGSDIYGKYGFYDSFNPTFRGDFQSPYGRQTPRAGWVSNDYLGIDQGPILAMLENYRSGFVWKLLKDDPYTGAIIRRGLLHAGFEPLENDGKWLVAGVK
jgi:hypothetical protein